MGHNSGIYDEDIYIYNELYNEDGMGYNDDIMRM